MKILNANNLRVKQLGKDKYLTWTDNFTSKGFLSILYRNNKNNTKKTD